MYGEHTFVDFVFLKKYCMKMCKCEIKQLLFELDIDGSLMALLIKCDPQRFEPGGGGVTLHCIAMVNHCNFWEARDAASLLGMELVCCLVQGRNTWWA